MGREEVKAEVEHRQGKWRPEDHVPSRDRALRFRVTPSTLPLGVAYDITPTPNLVFQWTVRATSQTRPTG